MDPLISSFLGPSLTNSDESCTADIYLSYPDRYIFWIGGAIVFLVTLFLMIGAFVSQKLREQPGDLILGIAFSDFLLSIHWIILAFFPQSVDDPIFCKLVGGLGVFAGLNEFLYNVSFSVFLVISLRNALRQSKIPKKAFHFLILMFAGCYLCYLYLNNQIGKTIVGTCSIKTECHSPISLSYLGSAVVALYVFVGIYTYCYVKKNAPKCQRAYRKRTTFLVYYLKYIVACFFIYVMIVVFTILTAVFSNKSVESNGNVNLSERNKVSWLSFVYSIVKLCSPLVLTVIRINDPKIGKVIKQAVFFWRKNHKKTLEEPFDPENFEENSIIEEDSGILLVNLNKDRKVEITYTLLSCVAFTNYYQRNQPSIENLSIYENKGEDRFKSEQVFQIEESIIKTAMPSIQAELERSRYTILPGTFKVYSPEVFRSFIEKEKESFDLLTSLDLRKNKTEIKEASGGDGGKSGEFFFFSNDNKIIIKTVPDFELKMLISILKDYENHFIQNSNSLIAKIYGAYTYENSDLGLKYNLIVMKNVCGLPIEFVERKYDIKGSTYDRQTLKDQELISELTFKQKVLKDSDFLKYEKQLFIKPELKQPFLKQIIEDSLFFRNVGLIDYSFVVYIVNKEAARKKINVVEDLISQNPLCSLEHTEKPGIYYNLGIIDYLQPYNFKKAFERFLKKLKNLDLNLDTSSQKPDYYSTRFVQFIKTLVK